MMLIYVFVCLLIQSQAYVIKKQDCQINIHEDLPDRAPLLIATKTTRILFPPNGDGIITISDGNTIELICAGNSFYGLSTDSAILTCNSGKLQYNKKPVSFRDLECSKALYHTARFTGGKCAKNNKEVEIGFPVSDNRFIREIVSCFDDKQQNTLYSQYNLTRGLASQAHKVPRPFFTPDNIYSIKTSIDTLYKRGVQRKTINRLVGLPLSSQKYVQDKTYLYLSRGHYAPKAGFVYPIQQNATFHYVNTAPQWQTFNGGNWNSVEEDSRSYVEKNLVDIQVYTGSYGVASLPHATTGKEVPLHLYVNGDETALPIPKLYWTVLYEPQNQAGVALIGVNNPFLKDIGDNKVCKDVSSQLSWLSWEPENAESGFSYACSVDDLRKTVTFIPQLHINNLLR